MANQYSNPAMFNGQLPPQPFYSPYHTNTQPPNGSKGVPYPQGIQHPPAFPAVNPNAKRFETNNHVPSPPPPFQLPPNWNPEVLRQLAASSNIQLPFPPPPPPPPPPPFFSASFAPNAHTQPANAAAQLQPFLGFQQARPPFPPPTPNSATEYGKNASIQDMKAAQAPQSNTQQLPVSQHNTAINNQHDFQPTPQILDSTILIQSTHETGAEPSENPIPREVPLAFVAQERTIQNGKEKQSIPTYDDLHAQAKLAISECHPFGATYKFWLDNGVKQPVLDRLFAELNLEVPQPLPPQQLPDTAGEKSRNVVPSPSQASTPQPDVLDPAMERKDRIARLLAARKGQPISSAKSSQPASPAPSEPNSRPNNDSSKQPLPEIDAKNSLPAKQPAQDKVNLVIASSEPATNTVLPSLVRKDTNHSAFAIPGLFMDYPDPAFQGPSPEPVLQDSKADMPILAEKPQELKSLKRGADPLPLESMPQAKRQASQAIPMPVAEDTGILPPSSQVGTPPATSVSQSDTDVRATAVSDITNKPSELSTTPSKPKINQNKLKDRMAALKADLLRKNSRKQTLQDGMPVLDAEVEKTRERLQMQQTRLSKTRKQIESLTLQLDQARQEETSLVAETERLQRQLADGENGQQQFSNELNQLNDQIVADEKESHEPRLAHALNHVAPFNDKSIPDIMVDNKQPSGQEQTDGHNLQQDLNGVEVHLDMSMHGTPEEQRRSDIEYSPDQEDLDRQLNSEVATTVAQKQDEASNRTSLQPDLGEGLVQAPIHDASATDMQTSTTAASSERPNVDDSEDDHMSIDEASNADSDGSASMSDSGSEDYEPEIAPQQVAIEEVDDYEPAEATPYQETENDDYEPAEQVEAINVATVNANQEGQKMDVETALSPLASGAAIDSSALVSPNNKTWSPVQIDPQLTPVGSPLVSAGPLNDVLTQEPASVTSISLPLLEPLSEHQKPAVPRFAPYQSPLSSLKSFRFHPQFNEVVKNGYRSLTYSNNIDDKRPLCSTELEGKMCTDIDCGKDYQHFGSLPLSDDKILVQMSSANDIGDKEQKDAYLIGLKKVIADLREKGVKDFAEVANALSRYRRQWMQSQSRFAA
ncbi:hypothetical protein LTR64_005851 [Lithohypha guttulata]|uniref:uncharacterized protein n=1 Tax=Lithohypha guttulata TaxID=1690604 RepID=UPI002DE09418|nr:hypothetical protein LTR51_002353 [Lithohypha guttulata]